MSRVVSEICNWSMELQLPTALKISDLKVFSLSVSDSTVTVIVTTVEIKWSRLTSHLPDISPHVQHDSPPLDRIDDSLLRSQMRQRLRNHWESHSVSSIHLCQYSRFFSQWAQHMWNQTETQTILYSMTRNILIIHVSIMIYYIMSYHSIFLSSLFSLYNRIFFKSYFIFYV